MEKNYRDSYEKIKALASYIPPENETIDQAMERVPLEWRYSWCENKICGCMGAANCSGRMGGRFTKAEWEEWVLHNPPPGEEAQQFVKDGKYDRAAHNAWHYERKRIEFAEVMKQYTERIK